MEDDLELAEFNVKRLGWLDQLFLDLNAISVIAFLPVFVYLIPTIHYAFNGRTQGLMYTAPWLVPVIAYWFWRFKYLRVRCRTYAREHKLQEYEKTLKLDMMRTAFMGATVVSIHFFLLFGDGSFAMLGPLFISFFLVLMLIIGFSYSSYWWNKRRGFR
jgi:hypothetical protein